MLTKKKFTLLFEQGLIASIRVVPVPFQQSWCIDAVVRMPLAAGSQTDTVGASTTETNYDDEDHLRKFDSIDAAASFLRSIGIKTFTVDTDDAISFANIDGKTVRVIEQTVRLWNNDDDEEDADLQSNGHFEQTDEGGTEQLSK